MEKDNLKEFDGKPMMIGDTAYFLRFYEDNSAPCSKCAFFNRETLGCRLPMGVTAECNRVGGTHTGWNTLEYRVIPSQLSYPILKEVWEKREQEEAECQKKKEEKESMLGKIGNVEIESVCRHLFNAANFKITNIHKEEDTNTVVVDCIIHNSINSITMTMTINSEDSCK